MKHVTVQFMHVLGTASQCSQWYEGLFLRHVHVSRERCL